MLHLVLIRLYVSLNVRFTIKYLPICHTLNCQNSDSTWFTCNFQHLWCFIQILHTHIQNTERVILYQSRNWVHILESHTFIRLLSELKLHVILDFLLIAYLLNISNFRFSLVLNQVSNLPNLFLGFWKTIYALYI